MTEDIKYFFTGCLDFKILLSFVTAVAEKHIQSGEKLLLVTAESWASQLKLL